MAYNSARETLGLTVPQDIQSPQISFTAADGNNLTGWKGDLLALAVTEKDAEKDGGNGLFLNQTLNKLDSWMDGQLAQATSEENFTGKSGQVTVLRFSPGSGPRQLALIGLGSTASVPASYLSLGESVAAAAKSRQASSVAVSLVSPQQIPPEQKPRVASAIALGIILGVSDDNRYKSDAKPHSLKSVDVLGLGTGPDVEKKLKYAQQVSSGIIFGRQIVNDPANVLTPGVLARHAEKMAIDNPNVLSVNILDFEQCKDLKMGAYLGVAAATVSGNVPHFIHLTYKPPGGNAKIKLALVGKAITFDSGGYNLKLPSAGADIENMKNDMGGAAAVISTALVLAQIKPPGVEVHFIAPGTENMISATGYRPGDILTASNGKTIEVNNTDAEGRLALADALVYACDLGVDKIVDLATLTGAVITALGPAIAGVLTPDEDLAKEVLGAAEVSGEKLWRLPLEESYWELMKSQVADMINTGPGRGGAITAGLFLKQFVKEKIQWLHIDIAGAVRFESTKLATGFGIATLVEWVLANSSS